MLHITEPIRRPISCGSNTVHKIEIHYLLEILFLLKSSPQHVLLVCQLHIKCRKGMGQRQNTKSCDPRKVLPANIDFGSTICDLGHRLQTGTVFPSCIFLYQLVVFEHIDQSGT